VSCEIQRTRTTEWTKKVSIQTVKIFYNGRTMDMFVPISTYPDTWCTPGVVSQIPESLTYRNLVPLVVWDVNSWWTAVSTIVGTAYVDVIARDNRATRTLQLRIACMSDLRWENDVTTSQHLYFYHWCVASSPSHHVVEVEKDGRVAPVHVFDPAYPMVFICVAHAINIT